MGDGGRCRLLRCPESFCRTRAGTLSFLHGWNRGREPFTAAQEKRAAVELCFFAPIRREFSKWVNHQALCLQLRGLGGSDSSRSKHAWSKTVSHSPLHAHVVPPDPTSSLQPGCHVPGWLQEPPACGGGRCGRF